MVGVMTFSMATMAAGSPSASAVKASAEASAPASSSADNSTAAAAAKDNMTVPEYVNNSVTKTPGIENPVTMGVSVGAIIDGVKTNYTVRIAGVKKAEAQSALSLGKVLNVFKIKSKRKCQISIWCPVITADSKVSVYQKKADGTWVKLTSSVRADHIDVVTNGEGLVAVVAE